MKQICGLIVAVSFVVILLSTSQSYNPENIEAKIYGSMTSEISLNDSDIMWFVPLGEGESKMNCAHLLSYGGCYIISGYDYRKGGYPYNASRTVVDDDGSIIGHYCFGDGERGCHFMYSLVESDGSILSVGAYSVEDLNRDLWFLKTDGNHVVEWQQMYGGYETENGLRILPLDDGGYLILGFTGSFGMGWYDVWLVRTDSFGNELWNVTYGNTGEDYGNEIIPLNDGYIIVGQIMTNADNDILLLRINDDGEVQWQKTFDQGNYSIDYCRDADLLLDGNILITARCADPFTYDTYPWLITVDQNGSVINSQLFGGGQEYLTNLIPLSEGGYFAVGGTATYGEYNNESQRREDDMWVVKFDETLTIEWMKSYGGEEDDFIRDFCLDDAGNIVAIATLGSYDENTSQYALKIRDTPGVEQSFFVGFLKSNDQQGYVNVWTPGFLIEKNEQGVTVHTSNDQFIIQSLSSSGMQYKHFVVGLFDVLDRN